MIGVLKGHLKVRPHLLHIVFPTSLIVFIFSQHISILIRTITTEYLRNVCGIMAASAQVRGGRNMEESSFMLLTVGPSENGSLNVWAK